MISEQIAEYWGSFKFKVDPTSAQKLDQSLKSIERRLNKFSANMQGRNSLQGLFKIDHTRVANDLNRSLARLSNSVTFTLKNFRVDEGALNRAVNSAAARVRTGSIAPQPMRDKPQRGGYTDTIHRNAVRSTGVMWHSALAGGGILSGFGLRALNTTLQELQMLPVALESVTGSAAEAKSQLAFLNRLGNEVGATRKELAPEYTKFFASAQGTALEKYTQSGYRSLTRYGKVMGLDQEAMKGTFKSITQMVSKQQIMAEELKGQTAERLPAAVRIMAEAVTGGDVPELMAMMKRGELDPNKALPKFFAILEQKANQGWQGYIDTTRYQQNISRKRFEDQIMLFGAAGGNDAFFRIWKTFADTLPQTENLVKALASAFSLLASGIERIGNIIVMFDDWMERFNKLSPDMQKGIMAMAGAWVFFGTAVGRAMLPLTSLMLLLDDMAVYNQGGDSMIGRALEGNGGALAALMGLGAVGIGGSILGGGDSRGGKRGRRVGNPNSLRDVTITGALLMGGAYAFNKFQDVGDTLRGENDAKRQAMAGNLYEPLKLSQMGLEYLSPELFTRGAKGENTGSVYNLNIYTDTNDPKEHGMLIFRTMQNLPVGE